MPPEAAEGGGGDAQLTAIDFTRVWPHLPSVRKWRGFLFFWLVLAAWFCLGSAGIAEVSRSLQFAPLLVVSAALLLVRAAAGGWSQRQLEKLGTGSVRFEVDEQGARLLASRGSQVLRWADVQQHQELAEAFLLFRRAGGCLLIPKRAFDVLTLNVVRQLIRRHSAQRVVYNLALWVALPVVALMAFLSVWHFLSVDDPASAPVPASAPAVEDDLGELERFMRDAAREADAATPPPQSEGEP